MQRCLMQFKERGWLTLVASHGAGTATEVSHWRFTVQGMNEIQAAIPLRLRSWVYQSNRSDDNYDAFTLFELWDTMPARGWQIEGSLPELA